MFLNRYYADHINQELYIIHTQWWNQSGAYPPKKRLIIRNRGTLSPNMLTYLKYAIVLGNRYGSGSLLNSDLFCSTNVVFLCLAHVRDHRSVVGHGFCTVSPL